MKIAIEARALSTDFSGVRTYTRELIRHLIPLFDEDHLHVLYDADRLLGTFPGAEEHVVSRGSDVFFYWWLHVKMPLMLSQLAPDLVHFTKADVPWRQVAPTVVTIHDTIPLHFLHSQTLARRLYWPGALKRAATSADHIITISEASRADIVQKFGVDPARITVTPLPVDYDRFRPTADMARLQAVRKQYGLPDQFILFVGTRDIRKNISSLIRAFHLISGDVPHHVVIAGKPALQRDTTGATIQELGLEARVHIVTGVADTDLPLLYSAADLFVLPSVYEGWGFPAMEAMACGVPVVVSDGGALPEVVGEVGEIVPFSISDIPARIHDEDFVQRLARTMADLLTDTTRLAAMRAAGIARAREFSWDAVARQTLAVYKKVV